MSKARRRMTLDRIACRMYEAEGASAVAELGELLRLPTRFCAGCETETHDSPHGGECLVCGIKRPDPTGNE
jgi:hypothetical protein